LIGIVCSSWCRYVSGRKICRTLQVYATWCRSASGRKLIGRLVAHCFVSCYLHNYHIAMSDADLYQEESSVEHYLFCSLLKICIG
jgi:hypothetical protein